MEGLVDFLPLLFVGLYYLLSSRRKARMKQAARERVEAPSEELISTEEESPTPFQSFLEQLEAAMAESIEGPRVEATDDPVVPEPEPIPSSRLERLSPDSPTDFQAVTGSFDSPTAVDHERHGFGQENPLSEEVFERQPAFSVARRPKDATYDPHRLRPSPQPSSTARNWRRRLQDPKAVQDAFVLQTIFGARGGIHGGSRSRTR